MSIFNPSPNATVNRLGVGAGGAQDELELLDSLLLDSELAAEDEESLAAEEELLGESEEEAALDSPPPDVLLAGGEPLPPDPSLD